MGSKLNGLGVWWMLSLVLVSSLAAAADLRLVDAAKQGDKEAVRSLLKQHVDVNAPQADGATALAWAAYRDDLETAELLIGAGANANAANDYGATPLLLACTNGSAAMVEKLLKAGASSSDTVFMQCVRTGNLEAVKSLLARGANVNAKETRRGQTALMWALAARHPKIALALIERGADVNARSESGFTPLLFAAQQGDLETVQMLLATGANVNEATEEGETPLLVASASGHEALSIFLLNKGADPNAADKNGFTALHFSLMRGLALISRVRLLKTNERSSAPHLHRPNMVELLKALLAHGANPNARVKEAAGSDTLSIGDKLKRVSGGDPPPGSVSPVGATPFLMAAVTYDANAMRILVAGGADPLLATEENVTPVMVAAGLIRSRNLGSALAEEEETRALEAVKLAVELGGDVNAADTRDGLTALHGAVFNGSNRIIQFLVEKGANLDAKDITGQTPLHKALNIKPPPTKGLERGLIPLIVWKGTPELLLKLGATPVNDSVAQGSDAAAATAGK